MRTVIFATYRLAKGGTAGRYSLCALYQEHVCRIKKKRMSWQMTDYPYPYEGTVSTNTANHPNPLDEYYYYINTTTLVQGNGMRC